MPEEKLSLKKNRIRRFFLNFEELLRRKKKKDDIQDEILTVGLSYIQMRLPLENLTPDFIEELKDKVEHNIFHAKIREAKKEDLEQIMQIYNRAWLTSHTPFSPITVESIKTIFDYQDTIILVAKVYGIDGGFIILDLDGIDKEYGVIAGLGILPRFQRKGLGTVLGMAAWNYFKQKNIKELRCEVYVDNKASYNFIKSLGFEEFETKTYRMDFGDFGDLRDE
jgi:ribosomal protein S18 acetylase RimI-like enzyme